MRVRQHASAPEVLMAAAAVTLAGTLTLPPSCAGLLLVATGAGE